MATWDNMPLITTLRDTYVNLTESFIIPSICKVLLSELPDPIHKLTISGFYETKNTSPAEDNFYCNYYTRQVTFNPANIGDNISISYYGRGNISIPSSQVYVSLDSNDDIETTLQDLVDAVESSQLKGIWDSTVTYIKNDIVVYGALNDNIYIADNSNSNVIQGNICRKGEYTNLPRYGIRINSADCDNNMVTNNDLYNSGVSASFSDAGTSTSTTAGNRL